MMPSGNFLGGLIAFFIVLAIGAIFTIIGGLQVQEYFESENWSVTEGNITGLDIEEDYDSEDGYTYRPIVQYRFTANGQDYFGNRYQFGSDIYSSDRGRAESIIAKYSIAEVIVVYYNPANPEANVLVREVDWLLWLLFGVGIGLIVIALLVLLWNLGKWLLSFARPTVQTEIAPDGDYLLENEKFQL